MKCSKTLYMLRISLICKIHKCISLCLYNSLQLSGFAFNCKKEYFSNAFCYFYQMLWFLTYKSNKTKPLFRPGGNIQPKPNKMCIFVKDLSCMIYSIDSFLSINIAGVYGLFSCSILSVQERHINQIPQKWVLCIYIQF